MRQGLFKVVYKQVRLVVAVLLVLAAIVVVARIHATSFVHWLVVTVHVVHTAAKVLGDADVHTSKVAQVAVARTNRSCTSSLTAAIKPKATYINVK